MFHINFKKLRLRIGLSQKQVADYLSITPQSVSKWETGTALPTIDYLPKLAECLNCDINEFFAPVSKVPINIEILNEFLILLNDKTKETADVVAYEKKHPDTINSMVSFCEYLKKNQFLETSTLQEMLKCSTSESQKILEQMHLLEVIERTDTEKSYCILKQKIDELVTLLNMYNFIANFKDSPNSKIDIKINY